MSIWRPAQTIRVKAIGLNWRDGRLLAAEVPQDDGHIKGVRPLGGTVEFGEAWQQALRREFREELGVEITITGDALVFENIYQHEGQTGHEVIFAADIELPDVPALAADVITFHEDNGLQCTARWFDLNQLGGNDQPDLYPNGLLAALQQRR